MYIRDELLPSYVGIIWVLFHKPLKGSRHEATSISMGCQVTRVLKKQKLRACQYCFATSPLERIDRDYSSLAERKTRNANGMNVT